MSSTAGYEVISKEEKLTITLRVFRSYFDDTYEGEMGFSGNSVTEAVARQYRNEWEELTGLKASPRYYR